MKQSEAVALWVAAVTGVVNFAILVAVGAKLQVAKEDFTAAAQSAAANPFKFALSFLKKGA